MKRILAALLCALLLSGCAARGAEAQDDGRLRIVTTLFPYYDMARAVAGERAEVTLLLVPGREAHSFEPTPLDAVTISRADVFVCNGGESEEWVRDMLEAVGQEIGTVLYMMDYVDAREEEFVEGMQGAEEEHPHGSGEHGHDEDEHGHDEDGVEYDEHVWTSPVNAIRICEALCGELCAIDPEGESVYRENLRGYTEKLRALDAAFRQVVEEARFHTMVFADRFPVRYFVEEYGLTYFAAFPGCAEDTEPSARTVAFLIDRVREQGLPAVFYIEFSNEKMADMICEDTGCAKLLFHSCHNVSADELRDGVGYLELMQKNLEALKEALG